MVQITRNWISLSFKFQFKPYLCDYTSLIQLINWKKVENTFSNILYPVKVDYV